MNNDKSNTLWKPDAGFEPYDPDAHARDLEANDPFNRVAENSIPGEFKRKLAQFASSDNPDAVAALREAGIESPHAQKPFHLSDGTIGKVFADANGMWHAVVTISNKQLDFTGDDRDDVMVRANQHFEKR